MAAIHERDDICGIESLDSSKSLQTNHLSQCGRVESTRCTVRKSSWIGKQMDRAYCTYHAFPKLS
jgi:hypothetical protein